MKMLSMKGETQQKKKQTWQRQEKILREGNQLLKKSRLQQWSPKGKVKLWGPMRTYPLSKHRKSVIELSHHCTVLTWKEKTYPDQWAARTGRGRWGETLARKNAHTHLHENLKGNGDAVMSGVVAQAFNLSSWERGRWIFVSPRPASCA